MYAFMDLKNVINRLSKKHLTVLKSECIMKLEQMFATYEESG